MKKQDLVRLLLLGGIWGGSFVFTKVLVPVFGPFVTAELRVLVAGLVLLPYFRAIGFKMKWAKNWPHYLVVGVLGSAIPFLLYGYAAKFIPASYSVILNSTSPMFAAVFSALWIADQLTGKKVLGLLIGSSGVFLVSQAGASSVITPYFGMAVLACLAASVCYALTGIYIKKFTRGVNPREFAGGGQILAGLALLPFCFSQAPAQPITPLVAFNIFGLSVFCSAIAYLLYYRLIEDVGPTKALTVTFLMPVFGVFWGMLFLKEVITTPIVLGCALILAGTSLIVRK